MLVSVIVLSRDRKHLLRRALQSLLLQSYAPFEVIVVGDAQAEAAIESLGLGDKVVFVPFDAPNVAAARNAGLAAAQGEITAFIDDDAVAETHWLSGLLEGFEAPNVMVVGGFVRARNGISYQWRGQTISSVGTHEALDLPADQISYIPATAKTAPEVMGTNCAYRSAALREIGGFDTGFAYFLDESDVNFRLAQIGAVTAIVPWAEVHHGLAPSGQRTGGNVPTSLEQIARSMMLFLDKHAEAGLHGRAMERLRSAQRIKLLEHMRAGRLTPGGVLSLLASFDRVVRTTQTDPALDVQFTSERSIVRVFKEQASQEAVTFLAWPWQRKTVMERAAQIAKTGCSVTVFDLSPSTLFHRVWFDKRGFWVHRGGIWGKSERTGPLMQPIRRKARLAQEMATRSKARNFGTVEVV